MKSIHQNDPKRTSKDAPTHGPRWRRARDGGDVVEILDAHGQIEGTAVDAELAQLWIAAPDLLIGLKAILTITARNSGPGLDAIERLASAYVALAEGR